MRKKTEYPRLPNANTAGTQSQVCKYMVTLNKNIAIETRNPRILPEELIIERSATTAQQKIQSDVGSEVVVIHNQLSHA
jgi:hypothetical protein